MACFCRLFKFTNFIFLFRHAAKKLICFRFLSLALKYSKNNAGELLVARRQFHAGINGFILFILYRTGWFSIYFLLRDNENDLKFNQISTRCRTLPTH